MTLQGPSNCESSLCILMSLLSINDWREQHSGATETKSIILYCIEVCPRSSCVLGIMAHWLPLLNGKRCTGSSFSLLLLLLLLLHA